MGNSQGRPIAFADQAVNLNQFRLLRVVGKGAFGKVRIVERKDTGLSFALKYILKEEVVRSESVRNIIRERRMLEQLNHPFLCNLRYSFQDIEYIYIVVDLMTGGDLRFHISRKAFTEEAIRFWVAELACALRYCHSKGIIHRDVKPDNVLLDSEGHVHLADFNVASDYRPNRKLTSKSGTMAYLAPEVYEGKGYLTEVDWWSLGVLFYECIYNKRPFEGKTSNQLSECIKRAQPKYYVTNPAVTIPCLRAIAGLLEKDVTKRIGAASWASFIYHPFFAGIDFEKLVRKEIEPIFRPSSDKTNFDASYDLEELLLEEAPLEARARRQKPRAELKEDASAKEIREDELHKMIETLFEPFDYTTVGFNKAAPAEVVATDAPLEPSQLSEGPQQQPTPPLNPERKPTALPIDTRSTKAQVAHKTNIPSYNFFSQSHPDLKTRLPHQLVEGAVGQASTSQLRPFSNPPSGRGEGPPSGVIDEVVSSELPPAQIPPAPREAMFQKTQSYPSPNLSPEDGPFLQTNGHGSGSKRFASKAGGVQMILDETGSWSNLADPNNSIAFDGEGQPGNKLNARGGTNGTGSSSGVFSFFRKKGREKSPKPMEPGVLGKEGARVIIN